MKDSRNEFYSKKLLDCKNGRETFQLVNKVLNKETTAGFLPSHQNDEKLCNDFEQFFHDKIDMIRKDIIEEISTSTLDMESELIEELIQIDDKLKQFTLLSEDDLKEILKNMSMKFCELDPVPTWLFMSCEEEIMPSLLYIIN